jgi:uncharacterized metal-binding protein YceD (DUF177 family)
MNLKEKVKALSVFAWNDLRAATDKAMKSDEYADFEAAYKQVRACERLLKAVRAQVRTHMRKTKAAMQEKCPHAAKVDTKIHHTDDGTRIVDVQACTACSKTFDLGERVS